MISKEPVAVLDVDVVENAYERILRYENEGELVIHQYGTLTNEQIASNKSIILSTIERLELRKGTHPLSGFVSEKFPELWEEAARVG